MIFVASMYNTHQAHAIEHYNLIRTRTKSALCWTQVHFTKITLKSNRLDHQHSSERGVSLKPFIWPIDYIENSQSTHMRTHKLKKKTIEKTIQSILSVCKCDTEHIWHFFYVDKCNGRCAMNGLTKIEHSSGNLMNCTISLKKAETKKN